MRTGRGVFSALVLVAGLIAVGSSSGATTQKAPACNLVPQLRDVTINQGVGAYPVLVNAKETLVRFYLSMPSCAGSGASIQVKEGTTLTVSGGGTVDNPTPVPTSTAYPVIASFTAAPMTDSTGDPKFVVPASMVSRSGAFTASFSMTLRYQSKPTRTGALTAGQITFSNRPGTTTPITASFDRPSNALGVLFVPMGDATKSYSSQWTAAGQQALQDGMTAAVARQYPVPSGTGALGGTGGLRYSVTPTLLDLKRLNLLDGQGRFCGTGANYDLIKAELAQFRLSHNAVNPNAQANRVVGVIDPAIGLGPPSPCFEGMAVVNSQEAWALAIAGRAGNLIGLELAHTLGLTPPSRESPFDGAHSQNTAAENPSVNRRYNTVQRSFITIDRSLLKPSATNPPPDNVNTLLEVPDHAFLLCVFGGTPNSECTTYGPGTVSATAPVAATLSFVMSGTTTSDNPGGICATCTGAGTGTSIVESYFASTVPQTAPSPSSTYRLVQRATGGAVLTDQGVPVGFQHSEHGNASQNDTHSSGLFSFALPFDSNANRIELWKGAPGAAGSLIIYARDRTTPPFVSSFAVGNQIGYRPRGSARTSAPTVAQTVETLRAEASTPSGPTTITPTTPLSASVSFGNAFASISNLCVTWYFVGDLFDPGETVLVKYGGPFGAGGAGNAGPSSRRTQTSCSGSQPEKDLLLDGTEPLTLSVEGGSVTVLRVVISVTGDSTPPIGYRVTSNSPSYTVAQGSSVGTAVTVTDDPDAPSPPSVDVTAWSQVPGGNFTITPTGGTPTFTSNGTLSTSSSTDPGTYWLVWTAKGGGFTRTFEVPVTVVAPTASLVVNTTNDVTDGACNATHCSLREAINASNASVGTRDTITFAIPGPNFPSIAPPTGSGGLPTITDPVTIDATTQDSLSSTPDVELDGSVAGSAHGLNVTAGSTTIKGFVIDDFSLDGIHLQGGAGNTVVGNYVGTDRTGQERSPNLGDGIQMQDSDGNRIGGTTSAERNVVAASGGHGIFVLQSDGNTVVGNYVGTDVDGVEDFGNGIDGIAVDGGSNNIIGPGNVTSGNTNQGVAIFKVGASVASNGNTVVGNTIGLGAGGAALPNGGQGVLIASGTGNTVSQNSISANGALGINLAPPNGINTNDLDDPDVGPNDLQNFPVLTSAILGPSTTVSGSLNSEASTQYRIEFFANPSCDGTHGEGARFLGYQSETTDASGDVSINANELGSTSAGEMITATATDPDGNTSEFSNCVTAEEGGAAGQEPVFVRSTDDNPGDDTLDLYLDCGPSKPKQVIAVGLIPNNVTLTTASWSTNYDSTLAPANCKLQAIVMDGFTRSGFSSLGTAPTTSGPNALVAAVSSPREDATFLQYGLIPLRGSVRNAEAELTALQWNVDGPGTFERSGTTSIVDLQPPNGGWPAGAYTATLSTPGGGSSATDIVNFTVLVDADNDGIPKTVEDSCLGGGDDDPLNAFGDKDGDGIPNASDPQPCTAATSYTAIVDFTPDPLPTGSSGNTVTVEVRVPGRNIAQVLASSVRITRIADEDIPVTDTRFANIAWTIQSGVGIAKFDRQKLVQYLADRNIHNRVITITVAGRSGAPPWSFEGSDTTFVQG